MEFHVKLKNQARKNLEKIDKRYKERILKILPLLAKEPYKGKLLTGKLEGVYSIKVWPYRILYKIYKNKKIVFVVNIKHRQSVYNN